MKRKGQFSETMTTMPVLLLVVILMALFLLASFWASNSRAKGNQDSDYGNYISQDSILFKSINVSGKQTSVAQYAIKNYMNSEQFSDDFKKAILKLMHEDNNFKGKESCMLFAIDDFSKINKIVITDPSYNRYNLYYIKSSNDKIVTRHDFEGEGIVSPKDTYTYQNAAEVKLDINGKAISIVSYYGVCQ